MTKKILALIQAIIQIIAAVFIFIPGFYSQEYFYSPLNYSAPTTKSFAESAFEASEIADCEWSAILLVVVMALSVAYFTMSFVTDQVWLKKKAMIAVPCVQAVVLAVNAIMVLSWEHYSYISGSSSHNYSLSWGFFVVCAFIVIVVLLELFRRFSKLPEKKEKEPVANAKVGVSQELREIHELFDSGIITAEEFEAKKKQLLGL